MCFFFGPKYDSFINQNSKNVLGKRLIEFKIQIKIFTVSSSWPIDDIIVPLMSRSASKKLGN